MNRLLVAALGSMALAPTGAAQSVREQAEFKLKALTADLQEHPAEAEAESTEGQKAFATGDKATACTRFKASRAEAGVVLDPPTSVLGFELCADGAFRFALP